MSAALSYSSSKSAAPLLGDTIGGNFDATVRAFGDREALVDCSPGNGSARRWTYAELAADVDALALGLLEIGHEAADARRRRRVVRGAGGLEVTARLAPQPRVQRGAG